MKKRLLPLPLLLLPLLSHAGLTVIDEIPLAQAEGVPASPVVQIRPAPEIWVGKEGSTLRESIEVWGKKAGWRVIWDKGAEEIDYPLLAPVRFQGAFDEAASAFIRLYEKAKKPLLVDIQATQKLIYVTRKPQ